MRQRKLLGNRGRGIGVRQHVLTGGDPSVGCSHGSQHSNPLPGRILPRHGAGCFGNGAGAMRAKPYHRAVTSTPMKKDMRQGKLLGNRGHAFVTCALPSERFNTRARLHPGPTVNLTKSLFQPNGTPLRTGSEKATLFGDEASVLPVTHFFLIVQTPEFRS